MVFYLAGGLVAMLAQVAPFLVITLAIGFAPFSSPFIFIKVEFNPAALLIGTWFVIQFFNAG